MKTEAEKLERFEKAVYKEVNIQVNEILNQAESSRKEIIEKANDDSLNEAYDKIKQEIKKISAKYTKLVSKAELDCKRDILVHREKLASKIIENVRNSLISFTQSDKYKDYLINLIKQEIENLDENSEPVFFLSKKDMQFADEIREKLNQDICIQEKDCIKIGWLFIGYKNQNVLKDNTLDSALSDQKCEFINSCCLKLD